MLIGLTVAMAAGETLGQWDGIAALLFYLCVYAVATIGTFAALIYLGRRDAQVETVDELAGLGRTRPWAAAAIGVFMFSLAGIPPLAGFWGKLTLFASALRAAEGALQPWFLTLAILGVLNAAVAAAYYLRIVGTMYFRTPLAVPKAEGGAGPWCAMAACVALTILIGLFPGPLLRESNHASPTTNTRPLPPHELSRLGRSPTLFSEPSRLGRSPTSFSEPSRLGRSPTSFSAEEGALSDGKGGTASQPTDSTQLQ